MSTKAGLVVFAVAASLGLAATAPAHAAFTCTYDPATLAVEANLDATGSSAASLARHSGQIVATQADGVRQCGEATISNTDTVTVNNVTPGGGLPPGFDLELPSDLFGGATDEEGDSDEIELTVNLGPGHDGFTLRPGPDTAPDASSAIRLGESGGDVRFITNADEVTGSDTDVSITGADYLGVETRGGDDGIFARGAGLAAFDPFSGDVSLGSGEGDDMLAGGEGDDLLASESGSDRAAGFAGDDLILGQAGADGLSGHGGDDSIGGGAGKDRLRGGTGDDVLRDRQGNDIFLGGPGRDICVDREGRNSFRGCEVVRD